MAGFDAMKGPGKTLLTIVRDSEAFHLLGYADGSLGIVRNREVLSIWEPKDERECLITLMNMTGWHESTKSLFLVSRQNSSQIRGVARLN